MLFARQDLLRYFGTESPQYQSYFKYHPSKERYHQNLSRKTPLGGKNSTDAPMFRAQFHWIDQLGAENAVDGEPAVETKSFTEESAARKIKATARMYGADLVGIGPMQQQWTYSHVGATAGNHPAYQPWGTPIDLNHHTHAIAMGFKMDQRLLASAPYFPTMLATAQAYALSAWTAVRLAEYIRQLGYNARAHHFSNYQVLAVPVAVDCGLGELSRAGYLLTREFGLAVRLSIVTTDLPMTFDEPRDIGVQSFCENCQRCVEACPSKAIPSGAKVSHNGVLKWKLDEEKCYAYWHVNGTDCGICMDVCPWTKPQTPFHRLMAFFASRKGPHQRWMARADRIIYGPHEPAENPDYLD
jgi:ferredoxin